MSTDPSLWTYCIESGSFYLGDKYIATGYSGHDPFKNRVDSQNVQHLGPIPEGYYRIGNPFNSLHTTDYALALQPEPGTNTYGRSEFEIHGDMRDPALRGTASHGCIILPRNVRERIVASGFSRLRVIARWDLLTGQPAAA